MILLTFIGLWVLHFAIGWGLVCNYVEQESRTLQYATAVLAGIGLAALLPFLLQLLHVPVSPANIGWALCMTTAFVWRKPSVAWQRLKHAHQQRANDFQVYEWPFVLVVTWFLVVAAWRCYYYPPTPRDLTSGAEALAAYAVKEHSLINSVFSVNLESTNNPFKPPFVACLQLIYKYAGFAFGQVWLTMIVVSFVCVIYDWLRQTLHGLIAGVCMVLFLAIPEMYAYTIMVLFDYSNAVYLLLGVLFLYKWVLGRCVAHGWCSAFFVAMATYIRTETLILLPCLWLLCFFKHMRLWQYLLAGFCFVLPSLLVYILCVPVYLHHYLPVSYTVQDLINPNLTNIVMFGTRLKQVFMELVVSKDAFNRYGWFVAIWALVCLLDILHIRRWSKLNSFWLLSSILLFIGIVCIGHLLPLMDIGNSTKRALFKWFPLLLIYLSASPSLQRLSQYLRQWEQKFF